MRVQDNAPQRCSPAGITRCSEYRQYKNITTTPLNIPLGDNIPDTPGETPGFKSCTVRHFIITTGNRAFTVHPECGNRHKENTKLSMALFSTTKRPPDNLF
jgi:hypothetical protein